jgi:3-hydroxyisobutyrate dehydrogenase
MADDQCKVAVIGLGTMGRAMAKSLRRAGLSIVGWNRNRHGVEELLDLELAESVAAAASDADVVITMVTDADAVESIAAQYGLLDALKPGAVWAQMSTIGVRGTGHLSELAQSQRPDTYFVDAPVSGSKSPAEEGALLIFASGTDEAKPLVAPAFDAMGQRTIWLGAAGLGSRMKLVNNTLLAFTSEGISNALALAQRLDLDTGAVIEAFDGGPLISPWESGKLRRIAREQFSAEFALSLALKDVRLALSEGGPDRFKVLAALADEWGHIVDSGLGNEDVTVVTRELAHLSSR